MTPASKATSTAYSEADFSRFLEIYGAIRVATTHLESCCDLPNPMRGGTLERSLLKQAEDQIVSVSLDPSSLNLPKSLADRLGIPISNYLALMAKIRNNGHSRSSDNPIAFDMDTS